MKEASEAAVVHCAGESRGAAPAYQTLPEGSEWQGREGLKRDRRGGATGAFVCQQTISGGFFPSVAHASLPTHV